MATVRNLRRNIKNTKRLTYEEAVAMFPPRKTIDDFRATWPEPYKKGRKKSGGSSLELKGPTDVRGATPVDAKFLTESFVSARWGQYLLTGKRARS